MGLKIAIPKESAPNEKRVAASVETVKKYIDMGFAVSVESGAGADASIPDALYKDAGASIEKNAKDLLSKADLILKVQAPSAEEIKLYPGNSVVIGVLAPFQNELQLKSFANAGITAFSLDLLPRISRAQSMDVLSSQSNLAGYKSVLDACEHYQRAFPMMMTAAGTVPPSKVFVMGAGVAGLQAIATARRLGAVVSATDVRPAAKEQVESLGASFVAVEDEEFKAAETAGGYAKEMSAAYKKKQAALIAEHIAKQDIVITTALIPGRPAPELVSEDMVKSMAPGSVIVDLAADAGGNCALSEPGKVSVKHDVTIVAHHNVPSRLAKDSSALYAKNLLNFIGLIYDKESKALSIDWGDEIVQGTALTKGKKIIHPNFASKVSAPKVESETPKADTPKKKPAAKSSTAKKATGNTPKTKAAETKKAAAKKAAPKKTTAKKTAAKKTTSTKSKSTGAKKSPAKKSSAGSKKGA